MQWHHGFNCRNTLDFVHISCFAGFFSAVIKDKIKYILIVVLKYNYDNLSDIWDGVDDVIMACEALISITFFYPLQIIS